MNRPQNYTKRILQNINILASYRLLIVDRIHGLQLPFINNSLMKAKFLEPSSSIRESQ